MPTNDIATWLMLQAVFFTAEIKTDPFPLVESINELYNRNLELFESDVAPGKSYRTIYCLSHDKASIESVSELFASVREDKRKAHHESKMDVKLQLQELVHEAYLRLAKD